MSEELKPCPFCGGEGEVITQIMKMIKNRDNPLAPAVTFFFVHCKKCKASTVSPKKTAEEAITSWDSSYVTEYDPALDD